MGHYAFLDSNNTVTEVIVGKNETDGLYDWEKFYSSLRCQICKQTSYNTIAGVHATGGTPMRKNYAGIGYTYDASRDAFIPPQPYPSWLLDESTCQWQAPVVMPDGDGMWTWDETSLAWIT